MTLPIQSIAKVVTVFLIPAFNLSPRRVETLLSLDELERSRKFRRELDSRRWACFRAALRLALASVLEIPASTVEFILNPSGKPELKTRSQALHFNLSHCDDLAVIAISRNCPVGIDIESNQRAPDLLECESTICHPSEIIALPHEQNERALALLDLWTAKEAFLKAIGTGLSSPPEELLIRRTGEVVTAMSRDGEILLLQRLRHPMLNDHSVHLCALQPFDSVEILSELPQAEH